MRLLQIIYFLEIAKQKSITKAAEELYLSQPALSKQMNQLEEELGTKLIRRMSRGIQLTEKGEEFATDCQKIMQDLDAAVKKVSGSKAPKSGTFRIGCFDGAEVDDFMPGLYQHLRSIIPDIRIKLTRQMIRANREAFLEDQLDLLIEPVIEDTGDDPFLKEFCQTILAYRKGALLYSRTSPLARKERPDPEDFAREPLLIPNMKDNLHLAGQMISNVEKIGITNPLVEYEKNIISLMSDLKLGNGYSLLSGNIADAHPDLIAYYHPDIPGVNITAAWKKTNSFAEYVLGKNCLQPCRTDY